MRLNQQMLDQALDLYKYEIGEGATFMEAQNKVFRDFDFNPFESMIFKSVAYEYLLKFLGDFSL